MSSSIGLPGAVADAAPTDGRRLVPMKVGSAVVYIEPLDDPPTIEATDELRPVSVDPREAFEMASDAVRECVQVVGQRVVDTASGIVPAKVGLEFTLTFDVEGRASIIPVLLTGKAKSAFGIKVSAEWHPQGPPQQ
jgi:Trypsin-co-occurring domain 1